MVTIPVRTVGDFWYNQVQVRDLFFAAPLDQTIVLDFCNEGPSIEALGVLQQVLEWCQQLARSVDSVEINNPNIVESTVLHNRYPADRNHFFRSAPKNYPRARESVQARARMFACFMGRHTPEREMILDTVQHRYQDHFLLSVMRDNPHWHHRHQQIGSLDDRSYKDIAVGGLAFESSIMRFYDGFEIELVSETFTAGTTFFPTEKTLRPIMGSKPFLVFGPKNFLYNLRELGYRTYHTIWDESYDSFSGVERWQAMCKVIDGIIADGYDRSRANDIVAHNHSELTA